MGCIQRIIVVILPLKVLESQIRLISYSTQVHNVLVQCSRFERVYTLSGYDSQSHKLQYVATSCHFKEQSNIH